MPWTKPYHPSRNQRLPAGYYADAEHVFFITIRGYEGQQPFLRETLNRMVLRELREAQGTFGCLVYTFCLMPDHLHFLVRPEIDGRSVLAFTDRFKGKTTNLSWSCGWTGHLWQPRYYDHMIRSDESLRAIASYILDNPVRKRLVASAEEWPWSGEGTPIPL